MKHFLFLILLSSTLSAQTVFFTEDFETDGNGTRYTSTGEFADVSLLNGNDVFRDYVGRIENVNGVSTYRGCNSGPLDLETGGNYTNATGSFFYGAEDVNDTNGCGNSTNDASVDLRFTNISVMGSSEILGSIKVATGALTACGVSGARWDIGDGLTVWYSLDGAPEEKALCFAPHSTCAGGAPVTSNNPLGLDSNCDGDGGDGLLSSVLTTYQFTIPAGASSLNLRIQMAADGGGQSIAFDDIQLAAVILPLPVALKGFSAQAADKEVQLTWQTVEEINNDFFSIEHSTDGQSFQPIGRVNGNGDRNVAFSYAFLHQAPANGDNFYRLKQVDFDGTYTYSAVQLVNFGFINQGIHFLVTPNPTGGALSLQLAERLAISSTISVLDLSGRVLVRRVIAEQTNTLGLDLAQLPSGTYLIKVTSGKAVSIQRVVKQ